MLNKKVNLVIGLTTFNNELLKVSIPTLGKQKQSFLLVIYNDNPMTILNKRQIRKLGYKGKLLIINSKENLGTLKARMKIVEYVKKLKSYPDWFIFCDDDDMLVDISIPKVSENTFAIIQNSILIRHRLLDVLNALNNPANIYIDGQNVVISKPSLGFSGMLIRTNFIIGLFEYLNLFTDAIKKIDDDLDFRSPVDSIMRLYLNMYAKFVNPDASPIYMDKVNYIKIDIDSCLIKYEKLNKPTRNSAEVYHSIITKYEKLMKEALGAIAPRG